MTHTQPLTRHRDIQNWAAGRHGIPAIVRTPTSSGQTKPRLTFRFDAPRRPVDMPTIDQGMSPVSWSAWLSEFDRQQLALKVVSDDKFEFVARKDLN